MMSSSDVATCVDRWRFATDAAKRVCFSVHESGMGYAGDESYLVCAAVAAGVVWFLLCVLQQCLFLCA